MARGPGQEVLGGCHSSAWERAQSEPANCVEPAN